MGVSAEYVKKYFARFRWLRAVREKRLFILDSNILCQPTVRNFWRSAAAMRRVSPKK